MPSRRRRIVPVVLAAAVVGLACDARQVGGSARDACTRCHGAAGSAAPPRSVRGAVAPSEHGVGAHAAHLSGGRVAGAVACAACHPLPDATSPGAPPHLDGRVDVRFDAAVPRPGGVFDPATDACSGVYCHGATLSGGAVTSPSFTATDGAAVACGACHGNPPPAPHPQLGECGLCHPATVRDDGALDVAGGHHVNGSAEVGLGEGCAGCHGAPPASGAHARHATLPPGVSPAYGSTTVLEDVAPAGADPDLYGFGCGHCHPLDPARHLDGEVEVELSPAGAPAGSLRVRNLPGAAHDPASGTCAGVACHSSGQASPPADAFRTTPAWTSATPLSCDGCHANPPRHASGGPGATDANSHLQLQADGWEWGHFGGLPGPWHTAMHGREPGVTDGAPITCQACHARTVDPAATFPGGSFWLDTTGDYGLGGALGYACADCHGASGGPPAGAGRVRPLRHVNGARDVDFDARTTLPAFDWLPPPPDRPTRPYWVTPGQISLPDPFDGGLEGRTLSMHLAGARYDAGTKTCTSVACHLFETEVRWGAPHDGWAACARCHGMF